jgi:D-alanyl-D-alanine carboxypeptidase (penicillin-binding protein 5/6)
MSKNNKTRQHSRFGIAWVIAAIAIVMATATACKSNSTEEEANPRYIEPETQSAENPAVVEDEPVDEGGSYEAVETETTKKLPKSVVSSNGILIDVEAGTILATNGAHERIVPASMTKILTVLVAAENISEEQLDEIVKIDISATDYSYRNDCSIVGFEVGERVTVRDLFYGTILPSGAEAAYSLAVYVAGSHEAFVDKMNEKLAEMGLSETSHMTNCVGLYDEDHYSTPYDIAMILKAASDNEFCREVLSAKTYTTRANKKHKDGLLISNWFLRRIEDQEVPGEVLCAKTGYVSQSGSCAASLAVSETGKEYICVTVGSTSSWRCIYDHVAIYNKYMK